MPNSVAIGLTTPQTQAVLGQAGSDQHRVEWDARLSLGDFGFMLEMADALQQLAPTCAAKADPAQLQAHGLTPADALAKGQRLQQAIRDALA